ncbi:hypothetical protein BLNAU_18653 [Blattamonas nauphoetae]|uniref:B30.2/SPRY domain-containing protein n=1 Tax=Blattamonas nauphoetae TaxID=2049346 RepID=A0ABQ9X3Z5_9EUKA|nr:hypothetical protein BLNAU_18653 [Blattamonas nauphoetae]
MESVLSGGIVERICREIESCSDTAALTSLVGVLGNVCRGIAGFRRSEEAKKKAKQPKEGKDEAEHTNEDNDSFSIFVRSGHALEMAKQTLLQLVSRMRTGKDDVEEEEGRRRTRLNQMVGGVLIEFFAETVGGGRAERVGAIEGRRQEREEEERRKAMEQAPIIPTAVWEPKLTSRVEGTKIISTTTSWVTIPLAAVLTEGVWLVEVKAGPVIGYALGFFRTPWDQDWSKCLGNDPNSVDYNKDGSFFHALGLKKCGKGDEWAAGDVVGVEVDMQQRRALFFKNGKRQPTIFTAIPPKVQVAVSLYEKNEASMELVTFKQLARTSFQTGADDKTVAW